MRQLDGRDVSGCTVVMAGTIVGIEWLARRAAAEPAVLATDGG
ncbi:unnamed protein product, partial [marine sediment metagenome]